VLTVGSVWHGRREGRAITLSFDDGPDAETTPRVLDVLAAADVKGAFFLIGERAVRAPDVARRIADEGHDLGNHTWSHRSLWLTGPRATRHQVRDGHEAITQAAGRPPAFFRAPWGMTNVALFPVLRALGTPCVFWSIQPEGRRAVGAEEQVEHCRRRARPGAILDLHDADGVRGAGRRLLEALPALIGTLRAEGYDLVPLRDLL
jgi:peptidoglycan/xylan/chitin deacetylase (PgdA/CDA1 family)